MSDTLYAVLAILVVAAVTWLTRGLPFLVFGRRELPDMVSYLGRVLPHAVMAMLVVYCLRGLDFSTPGKYLPELLCTILVAGLHAWKRNTLLSIGVGTVAYMLLVQLVF